MIPASVYIIACDEERHIRRALESVRGFAEVVLVDSGSTDATCGIAAAFPNVRLLHRDWQGYAQQKQWALEQCANDWVLNIDADEEVSPELAQAVAQTVAEGKADALRFPIPEVFLNRLFPSEILTKIRCFRRAKGRYDLTHLVHEQVVLAGDAVVAQTRAPLLHYGLVSMEAVIAKQNAYSTLKARERFAKGRRHSLFRLATLFPATFFRGYVLKGGFLRGVPGFISAVNAAYYSFAKEAKLYEAGQGEGKIRNCRERKASALQLAKEGEKND
ncbi:MAG: glycosyltransferase family 2 protein [Kiritimatiellaeota bacterium]|nr:glycosyltransferase family 2 protein [Kiritimatiellota bacterium]